MLPQELAETGGCLGEVHVMGGQGASSIQRVPGGARLHATAMPTLAVHGGLDPLTETGQPS